MSNKKPHTSWYYDPEVMGEIKMLIATDRRWKKLNDFITDAVKEKLEREGRK